MMIVRSRVQWMFQGKGFKIVYADLPLGPSFDRQMELGAGLFIDSKVSTGRLESENEVPENGILQVTNGYDPRSPPTPEGVQVWTELRSLADSREAFSGGTSSMSSGTEVTHSIFIGETDNNGIQYESRVLESLTGIGVYQGPNFIKHSYFDRFDTQTLTGSAGNTVTRHAGGISFKRSNAYPTMTSCYMQNITFGYCDGEHGGNWVFHGNASVYGWEERDGNLGIFLRDADGSVTGTPNACLVRNFPFYKGPECSDRPTWGLTVCPYRYIKMEILGAGGSLSKPNKDKTPMIIRRDDSPYDKPFVIEGLIRNEYLLRTHKSYLIDFNNQLTDGGFPESISFSGYGVEKGDVVRVGICQPLDVDGYSVRSFYPAVIKDNATWASSLEELDADTTGRVFFHDKQNGILFFKLLSRHVRTNDTQLCPGGYCFQVKFDVIGGNLKRMRSCFGISVPPYVDNTVMTSSTVVGCFVEKYAGLQNETIILGNSMTNRWCLERCKGRGYAYAGLLRGDRCVCGNTLDRQPQSMADPQLCRKYPCSGDVTEFCEVLQFVGHVSGRKVLSGVCLADFQTACGKSVPPGTPQ
ncbi:hypothetical protein C0Q70_04787 [Pomacea canaliculata]|uniref:WSC domain-containing protein n=1 Tax=Pomacea canaliculata TaxID=400727 RepID=A0A2T7PJC5_POMCA|nr:hypothetical protein C0Q70_04787 [Pomacea canaliculata]